QRRHAVHRLLQKGLRVTGQLEKLLRAGLTRQRPETFAGTSGHDDRHALHWFFHDFVKPPEGLSDAGGGECIFHSRPSGKGTAPLTPPCAAGTFPGTEPPRLRCGPAPSAPVPPGWPSPPKPCSGRPRSGTTPSI